MSNLFRLTDAQMARLVRRQIIWDIRGIFRLEALAHPCLRLCVFSLVAQAPLEHGFSFDLLSLLQDLLIAPEVDIGGRHVSKALVVAAVVVLVDKGADLPFQVAGREVVF
jgi:hypothetical protein